MIVEGRGKGSHKYLKEFVDDEYVGGTPVTWHKGKDLKRSTLSSIIRKFDLPKEIFD